MAGQGYCHECHAAKMRVWRKTHEISLEQRLRMNARSYLHVYIKRGKVNRGPCEKCGSTKVQAHHEDYNKPLEVHWLCKLHHLRHHGKMLSPVSVSAS